MSRCDTTAACSKSLENVQRDSRSSTDRTEFVATLTIFTNENNMRRVLDNPPTFKSHSDYLRWKKANALLHSSVFREKIPVG